MTSHPALDAVLDAIRHVQDICAPDVDALLLFEEMLGRALALTESAYGVIGEVVYTADARPHFKTYAFTHVGWHEDARTLYDCESAGGARRGGLKAVFAAVLESGKPVIARQCPGAKDDSTVRTVLALPLRHRQTLVGLVGVANRPAGYDDRFVGDLAPFLATCASVIETRRIDQLRRQAEADLHRSEEHLRSMTEGISELIAILRRDGTVHYASPSHERVLGYKPDELIGKNYFEFVHVDDLPKGLTAGDLASENSSASPVVQFRFRHADGSWRFLEGVGTDLREGSSVTGIMLNARDVTDSRQAAADLKSALSLLSATLESTADGILVVDRQQRVVSFNRKLIEMWEIPDSLLTSGGDSHGLGFTLNRLKDPQRGRAKVQALYEQPDAESFDILECQDGRVFERYSQPQRIAGISVGRVWSFRNVTERRRAEQAQQTEARISAALARVGREMIASLDMPAIVEHLCRLTAEALECDFSRALLWRAEQQVYLPVASYGDSAEHWEALRLLRLPQALMAPLLDRLQRAEVVTFDGPTTQDLSPAAHALHEGVTAVLYVALRRGGELIGVLSAGYRERQLPLTSDQQRIAAGIAQLASLALENARLFEELENANRLRADFVATMSHELRTPLHVIMGYTDLLLEGEFGRLNDEQAGRVQRLGSAALNLLDLINATLDVSRLESGRVPIKLKEVHAQDLINELDAERRETLDKPAVKFVCNVAPALPRLQTDPTKLKVVLKNLIVNAMKFTEQGSVVVDVRAEDGGVAFSVTDTGIGMGPEAKAVIFEPFRQADSSLNRDYGGAGLGLYIARRLLEMLNGTISVESEVGRGSTFRVWIPVQYVQ